MGAVFDCTTDIQTIRRSYFHLIWRLSCKSVARGGNNVGFLLRHRVPFGSSLSCGRAIRILQVYKYESFFLTALLSLVQQPTTMSQHKHIINVISKQVIPPLSSKLHKGQAGAFLCFACLGRPKC
jgi:hypothetical protein